MIPRRSSVSGTASIPAPTGGLNARDALANMPESDAVILENWFPTPSSVDLRSGYSNYVTGLPGWVETLALYNGPSIKKLFGVSVTSIYDVSTAGVVGAPSVTGLTNARWQHVNFGTPGGNYLQMVNGADKLRGYDGTSWWTDGDGTHDITGFNTVNAAHINIFKNRTWFVEKNSLKVWYLAVDTIAGAATSINLGSLFRLGGYLQCMVNWTINNQGGIDDYAAFVSSEGEIALYQGTDPSSASTWALVGIFRIGRPIGRRCFVKVGSDVLFVCADGVFPISKALLNDRSQLNASLSDKIQDLINTDVQSYQGNFGWQPILYPIGNKLIINVPKVENNTQYQYVMNTTNGSWCKFTGWNSACWEFFNDGLYFGGNTVVCLGDSGTSDNGASIMADAKPAFTYFRRKGQIKRVTMARPIFSATASFSPALALNTDFQDLVPQTVTNYIATTGGAWDTSPWDVTAWSASNLIVKNWITVNGVGTAISLRVKVSLKGNQVSWQATDYAYETGGVL